MSKSSDLTLLIGGAGQVGRELQSTLSSLGTVLVVERPQLDLTQPDKIRQFMREVQPRLTVNATAYTAVDKAESDSEVAMAVNAIAPGIFAEESQRLGSTLVHLSTDYVFDGTQSHPYVETDATHPLGVYGQSKLAGEQAIQSACDNYVILRTAWVYGIYGKGNFVKTMLRLGEEREEIRVVADQIGSPTWARHLAQAVAQLAHRGLPGQTQPDSSQPDSSQPDSSQPDSSQANSSQPPIEAGIYHYTNSGVASWYDFAIAIFEEARSQGFAVKVKRAIPITTAEYPTAARRPAYSVLSCAKIAAVLGTQPPHWREGLRQMIGDFRF